MRSRRPVRFAPALAGLLLLAAGVYTPSGLAQSARPSALPSPEQFFGFQMGADRKLANWDKLLEYYQLLAKGSNRVKLVELGKTSEGRPYHRAVHLVAGQPREARSAAADQRARWPTRAG